MNKKSAFSYTEVIISLFILVFILLSTLKLNVRQNKNYIKINKANEEFLLFKSFVAEIKNKKIFFENNREIVLKNKSDIESSEIFSDFNLNLKNFKDFYLKINIKKENLDLYSKIFQTNIWNIEFKIDGKTYEDKILIIKE